MMRRRRVVIFKFTVEKKARSRVGRIRNQILAEMAAQARGAR